MLGTLCIIYSYFKFVQQNLVISLKDVTKNYDG